MRVKISDADHQRWEVPLDVRERQLTSPPPPPEKLIVKESRTRNVVEITTAGSDLVFTLYKSSPFGFTITRKSNRGDILFDTRGAAPLVFKDQYIEISSKLPPSSSLYGLGEHTRKQLRLSPGRTYTLWNADIGSSNPDVNLYGSHPFYLDLRRPGRAHGVFLLNSNGMDVDYTGSRIAYKLIGGVLDFFFFGGPDPVSVLRQYTDVVGRPAPMPYWSFGNTNTNLLTLPSYKLPYQTLSSITVCKKNIVEKCLMI